eukprot:scaffold32579_cov49-Phaeocystis_antarctica.AAC.1
MLRLLATEADMSLSKHGVTTDSGLSTRCLCGGPRRDVESRWASILFRTERLAESGRRSKLADTPHTTQLHKAMWRKCRIPSSFAACLDPSVPGTTLNLGGIPAWNRTIRPWVGCLMSQLLQVPCCSRHEVRDVDVDRVQRPPLVPLELLQRGERAG